MTKKTEIQISFENLESDIRWIKKTYADDSEIRKILIDGKCKEWIREQIKEISK